MIIGLRGVGENRAPQQVPGSSGKRGLSDRQTEITHETDFKGTIARLVRRIILSFGVKEKIRDATWRAAGVLKAFTVKTPEGYELGLECRGFAREGRFRNL